MVVARQDAKATPLVKIPQPQRLIVARGQYPGKLRGIGMEFHRPDVIQVPQQREEASPELVIPHLDLVIVAAGDDEGFVEVKIHAADGAVVFFESVYDCAHAVVPPDTRTNERIYNSRERGRLEWGGERGTRKTDYARNNCSRSRRRRQRQTHTTIPPRGIQYLLLRPLRQRMRASCLGRDPSATKQIGHHRNVLFLRNNHEDLGRLLYGSAHDASPSPSPLGNPPGEPSIYSQLNDAVVQCGAYPRPDRVEGEALHPRGFALELGEHG